MPTFLSAGGKLCLLIDVRFLPFLISRCKNNVARFKTKFWVRFWGIWTRGLEFCGTWIWIQIV